MPFDVIDLIEKDETLSTCLVFNAEVCFGSGLRYDTCLASQTVHDEIEDFLLDNDLAAYFLGVSQDFKHFGFAVSVLILNGDATKMVRLIRKEACYCQFTPANKDGSVDKVLYANCRNCFANRADIEEIELLAPTAPWRDLQDKLAKNSKERKFAVVSRFPTVDSTYYPISYYAALFKGKCALCVPPLFARLQNGNHPCAYAHYGPCFGMFVKFNVPRHITFKNISS